MQLLGLVLLACLLLLTTVQSSRAIGTPDYVIPTDEVVRSLIYMGWTPLAATSIASRVKTEYSSELTEATGFIGFYMDACPGSIIIGSTGVDRLYALEHEYHHAWDHRFCDWHLINTARQDMMLLVDMPEARQAMKQTSARDDIHLNHNLLTTLHFDYARLPSWYREKYYSYSLHHKTYLANVSR